MAKPQIIKFVGTALSFLATSGAVFIPEPYRVVVVGIAGIMLGWLHLPQPKAAS